MVDLNAIEQRTEKQGVVTFDDIEAVIEYARELEAALAQLIADTGDALPGWSAPIDPYNYCCLYCGAISRMDTHIRAAITHDDDCPVAVAQRLLDATTADNRARSDAAGKCTEQTA